MAYNEFLADRILQAFKDKGIEAVEKKMMGGLTFMVNEKMCAGVIKDMLMARLDPDIYQEALKKKGYMVFSTTRTAQRENLFKWVGPIIQTRIGIIAKKSKHIRVAEASELNQYRIGTVLKDIGELLVIEAGVGLTVAGVLITIYHVFAARGRS